MTSLRIYIVNYPYPENEADAGQWLGAWPDDYVYRVWFDTGSTWGAGDTFTIISNKPLSTADVYEFNVTGPQFSEEQLAALVPQGVEAILLAAQEEYSTDNCSAVIVEVQ